MKEKKTELNKKDYKLKLMGIGVWYLVCFVPCALLAVLFIGRSVTKDFWLWRFVFAFGGAAVAEIAVYLFVFPVLLGGARREYRRLLKCVVEQGYTPQVVSQMELALAGCQDKKSYSSYRNGYCKLLCEAYAQKHEYDKALYYHSLADVGFLFRYSTLTFVRDQVMWHAQLIQVNAIAGNISASEKCMQQADSFFKSVRGKDEFVDYAIDMSTFEYYLAVGDFERCAALAQPYTKKDAFKLSAVFCLARLYALKGDTELSRQYFDEAYSFAQNDYIKNRVLAERAAFLGQ